MIICDTHVHSLYSFDGHDSVDAVCRAAIDKGLASIVFTDHCDLDCEAAGLYPKLDADNVFKAVGEAKEKYKGKLDIGCGIELGQPYNVPEEAGKVLSRGYDIVLCSVHNLKDVPDFSFMNYTEMPDGLIDSLIRRYLDDLISSADTDGVDIITHATYPSRYLYRQGIHIDMMKYADRYEVLFEKMIETGKALEYNVSGIRRNEPPSPTIDFMKLYRDLGGEFVACGSDAHYAKDVGANIADAYKQLAAIGFKYITVYRNGKKDQIKID
mgnify:FL=1